MEEREKVLRRYLGSNYEKYISVVKEQDLNVTKFSEMEASLYEFFSLEKNIPLNEFPYDYIHDFLKMVLERFTIGMPQQVYERELAYINNYKPEINQWFNPVIVNELGVLYYKMSEYIPVDDDGIKRYIPGLFKNVMFSLIARFMLKLNVLPIEFLKYFDPELLENDDEYLYPFYLESKSPVNRLLFSSFIENPYKIIVNEIGQFGIKPLEKAILYMNMNVQHVLENIRLNKIRGAKGLQTHTINKEIKEINENIVQEIITKDLKHLVESELVIPSIYLTVLRQGNVREYSKLRHDRNYKNLIFEAEKRKREKKRAESKPRMEEVSERVDPVYEARVATIRKATGLK